MIMIIMIKIIMTRTCRLPERGPEMPESALMSFNSGFDEIYTRKNEFEVETNTTNKARLMLVSRPHT